MRLRIPINPFKENEEQFHKDPKDMSLEELELLLYSKRLNLKLDMERLHKKVNYSMIFFELMDTLGITEKILSFIEKKNVSEQPEAENKPVEDI